MAWRVEISRTAEGHLKKLDRQTRAAMVRYLRERIEGATTPRDFGKPLRGKKKGLWRYRVGDYQIICDIRNDDEAVVVLGLGHRKHIYR